jgi:small-conductance mechanosensitive channel
MDTVLDAARAQIDKLQKQLGEHNSAALTDEQLAQLRTSALSVQSSANDAAAAIAPQLSGVQARAAELGKPVPGAHEAPDLVEQRRQLAKSQTNLDSQLKLARLISVEAGQIVEQSVKLRRSQFQAQMGSRTASIFSGSFWRELTAEWPRDANRLDPVVTEVLALPDVVPAFALTFLLVATVLVLWLYGRIRGGLLRLTAAWVAPGRLRRSLHAVAGVLLAALTPAFIVWMWQAGIVRYGGSDVSAVLAGLLGDLIGAATFGGLFVGLGHALLEVDRPSWRLTSLSDTVANRLSWAPWGLAIPVVASWILRRLASLANISLASSVAVDCVMSLVIGVVMVAVLRGLQHVPVPTDEKSASGARRPPPFWATVLVVLVWTALIIAVVSLLIGYVALGSFMIRQLIWSLLVLAVAYLLSVLIDDGFVALLHAVQRHDGHGDLAHSTAMRVRSQATVLLSALCRLAVYALALIMLIAPFGEGPDEWARRAEYLYQGIAIGEMQIRPTSVLLSVVVLVLGVIVVRLLKGWLSDRFLPTTSLDPGMRLSTTTLFGYVGYVIVVALAMTAAGMGLERVAWVASALSVGIGFGLQAVVQNFVSGLILLAERPVKVGDWVSLGDVEGDIRRINVRATEIQMGDRSTVIVPNSEFITKVVRNVTRASPLGRVQFVVVLPTSTDPEQALNVMLAVLKQNRDILDVPEPSVLMDGISAGGLAFRVTGYVSSPRLVSAVRSDLLFAVLKELKAAGMPLVTPSSIIVTSEAGSAKQGISADGSVADRAE